MNEALVFLGSLILFLLLAVVAAVLFGLFILIVLLVIDGIINWAVERKKKNRFNRQEAEEYESQHVRGFYYGPREGSSDELGN